MKAFLGFILLTVLSDTQATADSVPFADIGRQIEAADFAGDVQALARLQAQLTDAVKQPTPGKYTYYYLGYADHALAEVYADTESSKATDCLHDAEDALKQAITLDPNFAEAYALLGSSYGLEIGLHPFKGMWLGGKSNGLLAKALQLAPDNPRVLMQRAISDYSTPATFGGDKQRALREYTAALARYDAYKPADDQAPTWGHATAYVWRGDAEVGLNDPEAARKDYTAALALVPGYKLAAAKLAKLTPVSPAAKQ